MLVVLAFTVTGRAVRWRPYHRSARRRSLRRLLRRRSGGCPRNGPLASRRGWNRAPFARTQSFLPKRFARRASAWHAMRGRRPGSAPAARAGRRRCSSKKTKSRLYTLASWLASADKERKMRPARGPREICAENTAIGNQIRARNRRLQVRPRRQLRARWRRERRLQVRLRLRVLWAKPRRRCSRRQWQHRAPNSTA